MRGDICSIEGDLVAGEALRSNYSIWTGCSQSSDRVFIWIIDSSKGERRSGGTQSRGGGIIGYIFLSSRKISRRSPLQGLSTKPPEQTTAHPLFF